MNKRLIFSILLLLSITYATLMIYLPVSEAIDWNDGTLVSYWKLDETTGTIAYDNKSINNLTINGATQNVGGKIETSYYFDGANDYLNKSAFDGTSTNFQGSISIWVNASDQAINDNTRVFEVGNATDRLGFYIDGFVTHKMQFYVKKANVDLFNNLSTSAIEDNQWHHYVGTWNSTGASLWVDGVNVANVSKNCSANIGSSVNLYFGEYIGGGSFYMKGRIDEAGLWNKTLNSTEILDLYGSGSGLPLGVNLLVSQISPADATTLTSYQNTTFNCTALPTSLNNFTIFIWNSSNSVIYTYSSASTPVSSSFALPKIDTYSWNCLANFTSGLTGWATTNRTIAYTPNIAVLDHTTYDNVLELSNYTFNITINKSDSLSTITPSFIYNGTTYTSGITSETSGNNITYTKELNIPYITQDNITINTSSYWSFNISLNGSYRIQNSSTDYTINHQMGMMNMSSCSGNYTYGFYNVTYLVEGNVSNNLNLSNFWNYALVNPDNTTFTRNLTSPASSTYSNFNFHHNWCIHYADSEHYFVVRSNTSEIKNAYDSTIGYLDRKDYVCSFANGTAVNNSLYMLLNTTDYQKFYINIKDANQSNYVGAYVSFYRWFDNEWIYIGSELSDSYGNIVGRLIEDKLYRIIIKDSLCNTLKEIQVTMTCQSLPCTYDIVITETSEPYYYVKELDDFSYSFDYDTATKIVTLDFEDGASQTSSVVFVTYYRSVGSSDTEVCTDTSYSYSDSLSCNVSAYDSGSFISYMYVYKTDGDVFVRTYTFDILPAKDIFGKDGLLWGILLIVVLFFAGIWNPVVAVVFAIVGLIILGITGIVALPWLFFALIITVAVIVIIKLKS